MLELCPKPCGDFLSYPWGMEPWRWRMSEGSKEQSPCGKWPEERRWGYSQAVCHGGHLPGGAAFPRAFHLLLLADAGRRGQKDSVKTPPDVGSPLLSCMVSPHYPGDRLPLGGQVLYGHSGWPQSGPQRSPLAPSTLPLGFGDPSRCWVLP